MAPDDPWIQWALGITLRRVGRGKEAVPVDERVIADRCPRSRRRAVTWPNRLPCADRCRTMRGAQTASAAGVAPDDPHSTWPKRVRLAKRRPAAVEESARRAVA